MGLLEQLCRCCCYGIYDKLTRFILEHFSMLSQWLTFVDTVEEFRILIPLSFLVGIGIGFTGSVLSVRKHLKEV